MTYIDSIAIAAQHAHDSDFPAELLPLVIASQASLLAGFEAGHCSSAWD